MHKQLLYPIKRFDYDARNYRTILKSGGYLVREDEPLEVNIPVSNNAGPNEQANSHRFAIIQADFAQAEVYAFGHLITPDWVRERLSRDKDYEFKASCIVSLIKYDVYKDPHVHFLDFVDYIPLNNWCKSILDVKIPALRYTSHPENVWEHFVTKQMLRRLRKYAPHIAVLLKMHYMNERKFPPVARSSSLVNWEKSL